MMLIEATDGVQALPISMQHYDLLITDVNMHRIWMVLS